ncbi:nuclear transport factor 2 family protein [Thiohalorhabdus methylotrophus]|uniref:Nuclear transport factor 2 family protein n=1 Tax=Thiohalorhabdus methylotrophus TaxID=3242694 RepID=A0ABV4TXP8_9GAMM
MRESTRQLLGRYFRAYNARDIEKLLLLVHDDLLHDVETCRREIGKQAFARFLAAKNARCDEHVYDLEILVSRDGRHAAAEYKVLGFFLEPGDRPAPSAETYRVGAGTFFDVRDGRIGRISSYGGRWGLWGQAA